MWNNYATRDIDNYLCLWQSTTCVAGYSIDFESGSVNEPEVCDVQTYGIFLKAKHVGSTSTWSSLKKWQDQVK